MERNTDSISRIMTLRYDPLANPVRLPLRPSDFTPTVRHDIDGLIESAARKEILTLHDTLRYDRVAMSLSGGIDSRLTLSMILRFLPGARVSCVSMGFGDSDDEIGAAREIARTQDCDFVPLIVEDVLADLPQLIGIVKEPRWNLYQYYTLLEGKKMSNIFYTGDGGDETFGGYTFRYQKYLSLVAANETWQQKVKAYLSCHERDWVPDQQELFGTAVCFSWDAIYELLRPSFDNNLPMLDQVFLADFNGKLLFDWLPANISFSASLGLRIESVFLTEPIIRLATHIPWEMKYDTTANTGKLPLVRLLSKYEGRPITTSKKGFSLNLVSMWKKYGRKTVDMYVNGKSEVVKNGLISGRWVDKTMRSLQPESLELNPRYINKMLSVLALEIWYRIFVSKTMKVSQKLGS
ncbi:MAG: asparagine synthase C-terminal domain-containing protein [Nitrososphaera sp.]|jgi:asparagine synthase (glutamine-hydrolysing)